MRNAGLTVDTQARKVLERNGLWYGLERFALGHGGLYYGRPFEGSEHFHYHERWLIPNRNWSISRFTFHEHFDKVWPETPHRVDWYMELDLIEVEGHLWRVRDGYLDVAVIEGSHYQLWDADELADGLTDGHISLEEAEKVLRAFDELSKALTRHRFSGAALLAEFAPGLPH